MQNDPLIKKIKLISKKYKKWILIGSLPIKDKKKLRNRSLLFDPSGKLVKYYDKINMFDVKISKKEQHNESKVFIAGKKLVTAKLPWGNLGFTICFDLRFLNCIENFHLKNYILLQCLQHLQNLLGKNIG